MNFLKTIIFVLSSLAAMSASTSEAQNAPIVIGLSAEFGVKNSLTAQSIEKGILVAIDEINSRGGLLGGRPLKLVSKDDRGVPARGKDNLLQLAAEPNLVAVFSGRFSPVTLELAPLASQRGVILLAPWSAVDGVTQQPQPNYVFRLSLTDTWAIEAMLDKARQRGFRKVAVLLPNTAWGRSCHNAVAAYQKTKAPIEYISLKYNWGETSFQNHLRQAIDFGAQAIIMISNESEGVHIVQQIAELPAHQRLPIISHWGILGGNFFQTVSAAIQKLDLIVVQTFSFDDANATKLEAVGKRVKKMFGENLTAMHAQVGFVNAYDLTHLLALAIAKAGTHDRAKVRAAMERLATYDGLVRNYRQPFSATDHEALDRTQLFFGRFDQHGNIRKVIEK